MFLAKWAVRLAWPVMMVMPVASIVVGTPDPLAGWESASAHFWNEQGLAQMLIAGFPIDAIRLFWAALWNLTHFLAPHFEHLMDWDKLYMSSFFAAESIKIQAVGNAMMWTSIWAVVAVIFAKIFGYDVREHKVIITLGIISFIITIVFYILLAGRRERR